MRQDLGLVALASGYDLWLARRQRGRAWGRAERLGGLLLLTLAAWSAWHWAQGRPG